MVIVEAASPHVTHTLVDPYSKAKVCQLEAHGPYVNLGVGPYFLAGKDVGLFNAAVAGQLSGFRSHSEA